MRMEGDDESRSIIGYNGGGRRLESRVSRD